MNGVNLIPAARRTARRRAARIRGWMVTAPLCASFLAGAYGWLRVSWAPDTATLSQELTRAEDDIEAAQRVVDKGKARLAELQPLLRAARAVGDQPDWGVLLSVIAGRLEEDTVLASLVLAPVADGAGSTSAATARAGGKARDSGRPERFSLTVSGLSRTQDSVVSFVSRLEAVGVFDRVSILESRRSSLAGLDAVGFRVECTLSDPLPEGGAP